MNNNTKAINRLGETRKMNNGFMAQIIAYRKQDDIDVRFENGVVVCNRVYINFKRGAIKMPIQTEYIEKYVKCTNCEKGFSFLIDAEDLPLIEGRALRRRPTDGYIGWCVNHGDRIETVYLARFLMNCPAHLIVDHINGDRSDNRKSNLRICTRQENNCNSKKRIDAKTSKYKGVSYSKNAEKWIASITAKGETIRLGQFDSEEDAASAYNIAAQDYHGEYAKFNTIETMA